MHQVDKLSLISVLLVGLKIEAAESAFPWLIHLGEDI